MSNVILFLAWTFCNCTTCNCNCVSDEQPINLTLVWLAWHDVAWATASSLHYIYYMLYIIYYIFYIIFYIYIIYILYIILHVIYYIGKLYWRGRNHHIHHNCPYMMKWSIETRPSILCVTHQMINYKWYLMVLGQSMTILAGTWSV